MTREAIQQQKEHWYKTQKTWWSLGWEDPLEEEMTATAVYLSGESQGQSSLVGCHLWGCTESDTTEAMQQQTFQHNAE